MGIFNKKKLTLGQEQAIYFWAKKTQTFTQGDLIREFDIKNFKILNEVLALNFLKWEDCGCGNETEITFKEKYYDI